MRVHPAQVGMAHAFRVMARSAEKAAQELELRLPQMGGAETLHVQRVHRRAVMVGFDDVAEGIDLHDAASLRQMASVFGALYVEHIALEESLIYPAARLCQAAAEIAQRRRVEAPI